jgi:hypothetical protein
MRMLRAWRHWVHKNGRSAKSSRNQRRRLSLECLEDRTLPSFVAAPTFTVGPNGGVGSKPVAVVTGDFNNDGITDVVTANQGSNTLSLLLGNGNGTFKPAVNIALGKAPAALLAVDLNGDGRLDLVTANQNDNSISVLLNNGLGGFMAAKTFAAGAGPVALASGNINGDGHVDLVVADNGASVVTVLLGDGHGNFTSGGTVPVVINPTSVAVADFNGDGLADIATVSGGYAHLDVNINLGGGTFATAVNYATGFCANSVVVGDFNHDGSPDLAVACNFPSTDGVSVLLGKGDGTFQNCVNYRVGGQTPVTLAVGDFNGDGAQDLVTANDQFANNSVSVLLGNGDGTFGTSNVYTAGQTPVAVAVGDFNRDGVEDVVAANRGAFQGTQIGSISLLLGNGDGTLLASPDLVVPGPGPSVEADFNGDGIPDLAVVTTSPAFSGVMIFPGIGNGSFGAPIPTVQIDQPTCVAAGDFNGDHNMDLAVSTNSGVTILLGNGNGTFGTRYDYTAGPSPAWVAVDDFNGDGHLDLAVANNPASGGGVSILLGNGDGTFATASSVAAGGAATYLATGDFNGDGFKDLAVVNGSANKVSVVLGHGDGAFGSPTGYATQVGPGSAGIGDFNGDHHLDLAVPTFFGSGASSALTIFQNKGTGAYAVKAAYVTDSRPVGIAVADFNGDHRLDVATVNDFADNVYVFPGTGLGTFGTATGYVVGDRPTWATAADFNGDGLPDLAVVNSNSGTVTLLETPQSAATHIRVRVVQASATAGTAFQVTVTALDSDNRLMTGYAGTVSFTSTDGAATLPAAYTFTTTDHGVHRFTATLRTAGSRNIVVHAGSATDTGSITVVAAAANHLQVTTAAATAGTPFDATVTALDPYGNVATGFRGTVHFTTNDPAKGVNLPQDYTFTAADNGVHTFTAGVTLLTAGHWTITAIDPPVTTVAGNTAVVVQAAAASQLFISNPTTATAGQAFSVTVTAKDPYNNIATGFTGTVHFTSSDGNAVLPADYTFAATDKGVHTFVLQTTLTTAGAQSLTVAAASCTSGTQNGIAVKPAAAAQAFVVGQPANTFVATPIKPAVVVQVEDAYGNLAGAGTTVTLALSTNPIGAALGGITGLTASNGLATFSGVSISKPGQGYTLIVHAGSGTSAASAAFTVYTATHFGLSLSTTQVQAGTSFQVTVTALDATNHPDPTYVGTIHFSSTASPLASLPADYTFLASDNGQHTFTTVMLNHAGAQSLTVADTLKTAVKATASVTVAAGTLSMFQFSGFPVAPVVNTAFTFIVIPQDAYGNTVTGYRGTVDFTNSGGTAALPGPYTFTATDQGKHSFTATLKTVGGGQSLTVADQAIPGDTGTENNITVKA